MSADDKYFGPAWCDQFGNTEYPYIVKGTIGNGGYSIDIEEPVEFNARWSSVATSFMSRSDDTSLRKLTNDEVKAFVALGKPVVREELREANLLYRSQAG